MIDYQIWTPKCYTKEEYNLLIDFFNENYYHILEELVDMAEQKFNYTKEELKKQIMLLDIFQDVHDQLENYRDSGDLNQIEITKPPFYGDVIELMEKEKITYKEACERIANEKDMHNN